MEGVTGDVRRMTPVADNILRRSMESDACDDWREKDLVGSSERSSERVDAHFMAFIMNACHQISIVRG
jgi:hypothetical protein